MDRDQARRLLRARASRSRRRGGEATARAYRARPRDRVPRGTPQLRPRDRRLLSREPPAGSMAACARRNAGRSRVASWPLVLSEHEAPQLTAMADLRAWARRLKRDVVALWIAAGDARTPWHAKLLAGVVAAYALSPIDLIPDFIPVLGLLDDAIIVPAGVWLAVRLIPPELMSEFRTEAQRRAERPTSTIAAIVIALLWVATAALIGRMLLT